MPSHNNQDDSRLNTCMSYHVFREAGSPAPRCNYARVLLNGEDLGVFSNVESLKKPMLRRWFDDDSGNLYEGVLSDEEVRHLVAFLRTLKASMR